MGLENLNDRILKENGRAHVGKEIYRSMDWVKSQAFEQVNVDLISGMVGETWQTWKETVQGTIDLDPDSVTIYQMELPFNTTYSRTLLDGNGLTVADWDTKRAWHAHAIDAFGEAGYEISSAYTMVKKGSTEAVCLSGRALAQRGPDRRGRRVVFTRGRDTLSESHAVGSLCRSLHAGAAAAKQVLPAYRRRSAWYAK